MAAPLILTIDDDPAIRRALRTSLTALDFRVAEAANSEQGLQVARDAQVDAVLLDYNMPGLGGLQTCRELRRRSPTLPILMLTVRDSIDDLETCLEAGADDYICKPFHLRELVSRLRVCLRRASLQQETLRSVIEIGAIELNPMSKSVKKAGAAVHLTPKEFDLLHYLMSHAGLPLSHKRLLQAVWGQECENEPEYLRTFMRQLRIKLEDYPSRPVYLQTHPHIGYLFTRPDA